METDNFVHPSAREGFGQSANLYERARSSYPEKLSLRLFKYLGAKKGDRVLELGGGTGKWTQRLIDFGFDVVVIEPSMDMRRILSRNCPKAEVIPAVAEQLPFKDQEFDHVFSATAYHWFDPELAYREVNRVLKPGGGLGLLWTSWNSTAIPDWYRDVRAMIAPFETGTPRYKHMKWREPFDRDDAFKMLQFECFDNSRAVRTVEIVERLMSVSYVAALPELIRSALQKQIEGVLERYILKGQIFKMPEDIHIYWTHKI